MGGGGGEGEGDGEGEQLKAGYGRVLGELLGGEEALTMVSSRVQGEEGASARVEPRGREGTSIIRGS